MMEYTLTNQETGKSVVLELSEEQAKELGISEDKPKKTGYERAAEGGNYFHVLGSGVIDSVREDGDAVDETRYDTANYYSDRIIAENNARADQLMRQMRRFAAEHNKEKIDWEDEGQAKYYIICCHDRDALLTVKRIYYQRDPFQIYFDSEETAQAAIDEYRYELLWYFNKYLWRLED